MRTEALSNWASKSVKRRMHDALEVAYFGNMSPTNCSELSVDWS